MKRLGFMMLLVFAMSCKAENAFNGSNGDQRSAEAGWDFEVKYVKPEQEGGLWKRKIVLLGSDIAEVAIDKQKEGQRNWLEVGFTDENGEYFDEESTGKVRYRINGENTTEWLGEQRDVMLTGLPATDRVEGLRCIVPHGSRVVLESRTLTLACGEVVIRGAILGYVHVEQTCRQVADGRGYLPATLNIETDHLFVTGYVLIDGKGANASSGNGGTVNLSYRRISANTDSFRANAGPLCEITPNNQFLNPHQRTRGQNGTVTHNQIRD